MPTVSETEVKRRLGLPSKLLRWEGIKVSSEFGETEENLRLPTADELTELEALSDTVRQHIKAANNNKQVVLWHNQDGELDDLYLIDQLGVRWRGPKVVTSGTQRDKPDTLTDVHSHYEKTQGEGRNMSEGRVYFVGDGTNLLNGASLRGARTDGYGDEDTRDKKAVMELEKILGEGKFFELNSTSATLPALLSSEYKDRRLFRIMTCSTVCRPEGEPTLGANSVFNLDADEQAREGECLTLDVHPMNMGFDEWLLGDVDDIATHLLTRLGDEWYEKHSRLCLGMPLVWAGKALRQSHGFTSARAVEKVKSAVREHLPDIAEMDPEAAPAWYQVALEEKSYKQATFDRLNSIRGNTRCFVNGPTGDIAASLLFGPALDHMRFLPYRRAIKSRGNMKLGERPELSHIELTTAKKSNSLLVVMEQPGKLGDWLTKTERDHSVQSQLSEKNKATLAGWLDVVKSLMESVRDKLSERGADSESADSGDRKAFGLVKVIIEAAAAGPNRAKLNSAV